MRKLRAALWVIVGIAVVGFAFLYLSRQRPAAPQGEQITLTSFGGPFNLTGADGKPFSSASLNGKPYAIFFGFTQCPDVCPVTLGRLAKLRKELNAGERPFEILFVSVDPERDTPEEVGKYAALFNAPITGLTGSPESRPTYRRCSRALSPTVLLFDKAGGFSGTISPEEADSMALAKLKRISA